MVNMRKQVLATVMPSGPAGNLLQATYKINSSTEFQVWQPFRGTLKRPERASKAVISTSWGPGSSLALKPNTVESHARFAHSPTLL